METLDTVTSFARVSAYLQRAGRPCSLSPEGDLLQCRFQAPAAAAVVAMRAVTPRSGAEWMAVSIPVGTVERMRPRAILVANDELPIGALAVWQNVVLLRQTVPLAGLRFADLDHTLTVMVHLAAVLVAAAASTAAEPDREVAFGYLYR